MTAGRTPRPARRSWRCRRSTSPAAPLAGDASGSTPTKIPIRRWSQGRAGHQPLSRAAAARCAQRMAALYGVDARPACGSRAAATTPSTCWSAPSAGRARTRRHRRADLLGLRPVRPAAGRAGGRRAAGRRFRFRRRRGDRRGRAARSAQARFPLLAQQPDRHPDRARRHAAASPTRCPTRSSSSTKPISSSPTRRASRPKRRATPISSCCGPCPRPLAWPARGSAALIGSAELIALLARVSPPYPLPSPRIAAALDALGARAAADPPPADRRLMADRARLRGQLLRRSPEVTQRSARAAISCSSRSTIPTASRRRLAAAAVRVRFRPNAAPGGRPPHHRHRAGKCRAARRLRAVATPTAARRADCRPRHQGNADRGRARPRSRRAAPDRHRHPLLRPYARPGRGAWRLRADARLRPATSSRRAPQHRGFRDRARHRAVARRSATGAASAASASRCRWTKPRRRC